MFVGREANVMGRSSNNIFENVFYDAPMRKLWLVHELTDFVNDIGDAKVSEREIFEDSYYLMIESWILKSN